MIIEKIYPLGEEEVTVIHSEEGKIYIQFDGHEYSTESKSHKDITLKYSGYSNSMAERWSILFWQLKADNSRWFTSTATSFIPHSHIQKCYSKIDEISEYIKERKNNGH